MNWFDYLSFLTSQILSCCRLTNQKSFNFIASILPIDRNIFIVVIRAIQNGNIALPSFVSSAINESLTGLNSLSTINITSPTSRHFQFNSIHLSFAESLLLSGNISSISSMRDSRQRNVFINFLSNRAKKSIYKNISNSQRIYLVDL